jgi:hypothetical protein
MELVFDHPIAFHPANGVFNAHAERRELTIVRLCRWREFSPRGLLLRVDDGAPLERKALEAPILIEITPAPKDRAGQRCEALVRHRALIGVTQAADVTGRIDHQEVFDRVALLLAAVVVLWCLWIGRAVDRALGTIMPTRGGGPSAVRSVAIMAAHSSALRAGSSS